ncbi:MAG: hypothetical protein WCI96_02540 [Planctomycetota bacterium]|jgi:hypothetical protein
MNWRATMILGVMFVGWTCVASLLWSCGPRIEYRVRPGFTTKSDIPDEVVLEDGTIIRYLELTEYLARQNGEQRKAREAAGQVDADGSNGGGGGFISWEEHDDGTVRMQAERSEQIVTLTMRAFREERYAELWDQLVSKGVRQRAADEGEPRIGPDRARERFVEWCAKRRTDVMTLLNRMSFAFSSNAVIYDRLAPGLTRMRLAPQITGDFKFRSVEVFSEHTPEGQRIYLGGIR